MNVPYLDLKAQYQAIRSDVTAAIEDVLTSCSYIQGPAVQRFESAFAAYSGAKHCLGVGSGTDALHLALLTHGIGPGDEVITQADTFMATVEAILYTGAKVVFVDVKPPEYTVDLAQVEAAITPRTKAFIPVHLFGQPANLHAIEDLGVRHGIAIIHDASQAHGATFAGELIGAKSDACFSFYPGKNLGAYGEGGALVTNDDARATAGRALRSHGSTVRYRHDVLGYNYRMDGIQGAVLDVKLKHLNGWTEGRGRVAALYDQLLPNIRKPKVPAEAKHVYHIYPIFVEDRDDVAQRLRERGIDTNVHYPIACHLQPMFNGAYAKGSLPHCEFIADHELSLPIFAELSDDAVKYVAEAVLDVTAETIAAR